jgi:hypothetical protein
MGEVKSDNNFTRWTIVIAIIAAGAAMWTAQANLLSAFQLGLTMKAEQQAPPSQQVPKPQK